MQMVLCQGNGHKQIIRIYISATTSYWMDKMGNNTVGIVKDCKVLQAVTKIILQHCFYIVHLSTSEGNDHKAVLGWFV